MQDTIPRPLAVVTGASTGIGLELARLFAANGYDLAIAADQALIEDAAAELRQYGVDCQALLCDLSTPDGVNELFAAVRHRDIDVLAANAGVGLGQAFLDQDLEEALKVSHTNIDGTVALVHKVGRLMRERARGRILITGSIAGLMPGTFEAVYNGTKAFLDSFAVALSNELKDTGVTVTCLMPGPTETEFFKRAGMADTKVGSDEKQNAAEVAQIGYDALMKGDLHVVAGTKNKLQAAMSHVLPDSVLANLHRGMGEPGSGSAKTPNSERERTDRPRPMR
jgi:uncharacterized protein